MLVHKNKKIVHTILRWTGKSGMMIPSEKESASGRTIERKGDWSNGSEEGGEG